MPTAPLGTTGGGVDKIFRAVFQVTHNLLKTKFQVFRISKDKQFSATCDINLIISNLLKSYMSK